MARCLSRRTKNNPALIGEPGVGKTAVVEGLGSEDRCRRRAGDPEGQAGLISLDLGPAWWPAPSTAAISRSASRRCSKEMNDPEATSSCSSMRCTPLWALVRLRAQLDAADMLKPTLSRGELQIIGATTTRRVPQVHREGCRAGASFPACSGARADHRRGCR